METKFHAIANGEAMSRELIPQLSLSQFRDEAALSALRALARRCEHPGGGLSQPGIRGFGASGSALRGDGTIEFRAASSVGRAGDF